MTGEQLKALESRLWKAATRFSFFANVYLSNICKLRANTDELCP